jgi:hypothetical protein
VRRLDRLGKRGNRLRLIGLQIDLLVLAVRQQRIDRCVVAVPVVDDSGSAAFALSFRSSSLNSSAACLMNNGVSATVCIRFL